MQNSVKDDWDNTIDTRPSRLPRPGMHAVVGLMRLEVLCKLKSGRRARPSRHTYYAIGLALKDQAFLPPVENPLVLPDISAGTGI
jgi:hypothetical protein